MLNNSREQVNTMTHDSHAADRVEQQPDVDGLATDVAGDSTAVPTMTTGWQGWRVWLRLLPELGVLGCCLVLYSQTSGLTTTVSGPGPAFFPRLLIGLLAVAMLVRIGQVVREVRRERAGSATWTANELEKGVDVGDPPPSMPRVWLAIGLSVGYVGATIYLGWVIATFAFLVVFLYLAGKRKLWLTVPLGAGLSIGMAYLFVKVVYISLPTGIGVFDQFTIKLLQALGAF